VTLIVLLFLAYKAAPYSACYWLETTLSSAAISTWAYWPLRHALFGSLSTPASVDAQSSLRAFLHNHWAGFCIFLGIIAHYSLAT